MLVSMSNFIDDLLEILEVNAEALALSAADYLDEYLGTYRYEGNNTEDRMLIITLEGSDTEHKFRVESHSDRYELFYQRVEPQT